MADDTTTEVDLIEPRDLLLEEMLTSAENFFEKAASWHDEFDRIRKIETSFHNREHLKAVRLAAERLIDEKEIRDPLNLKSDLKRWNELHPGQELTEDEFKEAVIIFVGLHDTGNIIEKLDPNLVPLYNDKYKASDAEERSKEIARKVLEDSKYLPLVEHLIDQTKYKLEYKDEDRNVPFAIFVAVVDQIGNDLLSDNPDRLAGLINEIKNEDPDRLIDPYDFYNFTRVRFPALAPDEAKRQEILGIWGKEIIFGASSR